MDLFLLSYHSISVFTVFIISSIIVVYLGIKKDKILSTYWLLGVFLGYMFLYLGHFLSYSIFSPIAAYSTFFSQLSLLGVACFVAFSYHYPKNVYKQESKIAIPLSFGLAFLAISIFLFQSMTMDKMYSFSEHKYDFSAGGFSTLISLLLHLWCFIILFRKTILYSGYDGFLSKWGMHKSLRGEKEINGSEGINRSANILISLLKFFHPVGKDANSIKGFSRAMLLLTVLSFMGLLNSSGLISQEFYAYIFSAISLVLSFYIILIYLNNSSESTTLMIKLVGISLVTLLIVVGYIGQVMLRMSETDYDKLRLSEVKNSRTNILMERFKELPESIVYVLKKPNTEIAEPSTYELLFSRDSIVSLPEIVNFETRQLEGRKDVLKSKFPALSDKDLNQLAKKELASYSSLQYERLYRNAGIFYIHYDFANDAYVYEVGFSYYEYRKYTHSNISPLFYAIFLTTVGILILFPRFFRNSLKHPLEKLLIGVRKVNEGDLDVLVPIAVHDEIGSVADSFNTMVLSLKDTKAKMQAYAESLEKTIEERTREIQDKSDTIQQLRIQQDGYYFLTSLLAKPLYFNANKSKQVKTEFIIRQKNSFVFKDKRAELGGDICLTGNLKFGKKSKHTSFTFALNADAMGKSVQGAGGAMVLGVVVNAMLSRSASNKRILDISPRTWLEEFFNELNLVYKTFDGYLLATACMFLINDETGECLYINAGHPRTVLLRNEKANFIETSIEHTKKIGLDLNASDLIKSFKLKDKDILILGSDGKDHINLSPGKAQTRINEKEDLFLRLVEKANGKLFELEQNIFLTGEVTDDFSLLRLEFTVPKDSSGLTRQEIFFGEESSSREEFFFGEDDFSEKEDISVVSEMYTQGRKLYQEGNVKKAIEVLSKAFKKDDKNQKLNKLFGLACFKDKQYEIAIRVISQYLKQDPDNTEMWYYMSLAQRKVGQYVQSIDSAKKFYEKFPDNVQNLINLSDLYRIEGNFKKAEHFSKLALKIDPENKNAKKILEVLENVA